MSKKALFTVFFLLNLFALPTSFANTDSTIILQANDMKWQPLPNNTQLQYSVLSGEPSKEGYFVVRLRIPKGYINHVHTHNQTMYDTIISGTYYLGIGNQPNKDETQKLTAGSFIVIPPKLKHFGHTTEETIIQITGDGPWESLQHQHSS